MKKRKKQTGLNPDNFESISIEELKAAIKGVLLKPAKRRAEYKNKKPTNEELNQRWKLVKR